MAAQADGPEGDPHHDPGRSVRRQRREATNNGDNYQ